MLFRLLKQSVIQMPSQGSALAEQWGGLCLCPDSSLGCPKWWAQGTWCTGIYISPAGHCCLALVELYSLFYCSKASSVMNLLNKSPLMDLLAPYLDQRWKVSQRQSSTHFPPTQAPFATISAVLTRKFIFKNAFTLWGYSIECYVRAVNDTKLT